VQHLSPAIRLFGLGSYLATCIAGGTVGGFFLDKALETGRIFTLAGLALGLAAGLYGGYRMLMETIAEVNRWQARRATARDRDIEK
jgi:hypothetical protein